MPERRNEEKDTSRGGQVDRVRARIEDILTGGEVIHHLVTQRRTLRSFLPSTVVMTNRRLILYRPRFPGRVVFEHHPWRTLGNPRLREGLWSSTLTLDVAGAGVLSTGCLPKAEARRLYGYSQDQEERAREEREARELEGRRVVGGGGMPAPSGTGEPGGGGSPNPFDRLRELTAMRDAGLITPAEFEEKRRDVLSRM